MSPPHQVPLRHPSDKPDNSVERKEEGKNKGGIGREC